MRMSPRARAILVVLSLLLAAAPARQGLPAGGAGPIEHREFFERLASLPPIMRDGFLDEQVNRLLNGTGHVVSVDELSRYNRGVRIIATESATSSMNITYYIFTDQRSFLTSFKKNDAFAFSGLFKVYTPLSSRRDSYLFDVVLVEGAPVRR